MFLLLLKHLQGYNPFMFYYRLTISMKKIVCIIDGICEFIEPLQDFLKIKVIFDVFLLFRPDIKYIYLYIYIRL